MITYRAAYTDVGDGWLMAQVLDFPGVISQGQSLEEARMMIASALSDMAEFYISEGKPLPKPDPTLSDQEAELEEPIHLLIDAAVHVRTVPQRSAS